MASRNTELCGILEHLTRAVSIGLFRLDSVIAAKVILYGRGDVFHFENKPRRSSFVRPGSGRLRAAQRMSASPSKPTAPFAFEHCFLMQNFAAAIYDAVCRLDEHEKAEVASERQGTSLMTKRKSKTEQVEQDQSEREAILDERETLKRLFPATYSPDIGVFSDGKVEVMFKLTISQAQSLASLLKEHRL